MKVAIVTDFLLKFGGAERVTKYLADMFPNAPIYTLLYDKKKMGKLFPPKRVVFSSLQKWPGFIRRRQKFLMPLMPRAIEGFDFQDFDLVISSSNSFAKGIIVPEKTKHISYVHAPMRWAWDTYFSYLHDQKLGPISGFAVRKMLHDLRQWDFLSAQQPDILLANSKTVAQRIEKFWRRSASVLYPPVVLPKIKKFSKPKNYFLIVSRLSAYKNVDLAVEFFSQIGEKLVVIGTGPEEKKLKAMAKGNIQFLGFQSESVVQKYYRECRAFIFPAEDDFGLTPVEAMGYGRPVIALGKGGATETVVAGKTGEFFAQPTVEELIKTYRRFVKNESKYQPKQIRKQAEKFAAEKFEKELKEIIKKTGFPPKADKR